MRVDGFLPQDTMTMEHWPFSYFRDPLANVLFILIQKLRLQNFKIKDNLSETTNAHFIYTLRYQIKAGLRLDQSLWFKAWFCLPLLSLPVTIFKLAELEHDLFGPDLRVVIN